MSKRKTFFRIEYISEKPKSKKDKEETKVEVCKYTSKEKLEMSKLLLEHGLGEDGKKLTKEDVAEIIEQLDEEELEGKLTDQDKEWLASKEYQTEMNKKLSEDEIEEEDWEKHYLNKKGQVECLSCGAHNDLDSGYCWYCNAPLKQYDEKEISDELIQYTVIHRDGRMEHKWLTQEEYLKLFKEDDIKQIKEEK